MTCTVRRYGRTLATKQPPISDGGLSRASLDDVETAFTFVDRETGLCSGIMLQYKNGLIGCLGQCRFGIDDVKRTDSPEYICFTEAEYYAVPPVYVYKGVKVDFGGCHHRDDATRDDDVTWTCCKTTGVAEFWFRPHNTKLSIVEDD